jgi:hypothetical protein
MAPTPAANRAATTKPATKSRQPAVPRPPAAVLDAGATVFID